ncbi:hypothetical protein SAMN04487950_0992 [Halogranum rubrum]|uniref:Uncharacterized protein n=2 Tax=Halogranum rubrum TaxID=553466 RepID=A0A1I4C6F2_9EURY|nr:MULTISPECIES: hypothetical protein [Halogranum]EJN58453.1 hypothetical protein HSB1_29310 [Halogranum salarium B-1]SFK76718.1 hypothetical protein SAMN04487950_0992 [Halogranum rubrum]
MFGIEALSGSMQAVVLVGLVLSEAIALYVGYGGLVRLVGPTVVNALGGE